MTATKGGATDKGRHGLAVGRGNDSGEALYDEGWAVG